MIESQKKDSPETRHQLNGQWKTKKIKPKCLLFPSPPSPSLLSQILGALLLQELQASQEPSIDSGLHAPVFLPPCSPQALDPSSKTKLPPAQGQMGASQLHTEIPEARAMGGPLFLCSQAGRNPKAERKSWVPAECSGFVHQSFIYSLIIHPPATINHLSAYLFIQFVPLACFGCHRCWSVLALICPHPCGSCTGEILFDVPSRVPGWKEVPPFVGSHTTKENAMSYLLLARPFRLQDSSAVGAVRDEGRNENNGEACLTVSELW